MPEHDQHNITPHELYDYVDLLLSDQIRRGRVTFGWIRPENVTVDLDGNVWLENMIDSDVIPAIFDVEKTTDEYLFLRLDGTISIGVPTDRGDIRLGRHHGDDALPVHSVTRDRARYLTD